MDPRYEGRLAEIKERWYKLSKNTGNLREQDKRAALGTEVWGSNMLAKVSSKRQMMPLWPWQQLVELVPS